MDGIFFDSGGPTGNYSNAQYYTTTITPANPGEMTSVTFNSFSLQDQIDRLTIYNGPNTTYPYIVEQYGFTGTNSPGTVTSSDITGTLTFAFYSDGTINAPGWTASVSCAVLGVSNFSKNALIYYPNPTKDKVTFSSPETIKSISVYNLLGQLIQEQKPNSKEAIVDISMLSDGQFLFKVATDTSFSSVKILKVN